MATTNEKPCASCKFRARYDKDPQSLLGRFWRWHINFCPGWKGYLESLPTEERESMTQKYGLRK